MRPGHGPSRERASTPNVALAMSQGPAWQHAGAQIAGPRVEPGATLNGWNQHRPAECVPHRRPSASRFWSSRSLLTPTVRISAGPMP